MATLSSDLERLRGIAQGAEAREQAVVEQQRELSSDLKLLEELKAGNLKAVDVAAPVFGLAEAVEGARAEAEAFDGAVAEATGRPVTAVYTAVPEADGAEPAEVIAGTTQVVRELGAALARARKRLAAMQQLAEDAERARGETDAELDALRAEHERVLAALAATAAQTQMVAAPSLVDAQAPAPARAEAALAVVQQLATGGGPGVAEGGRASGTRRG